MITAELYRLQQLILTQSTMGNAAYSVIYNTSTLIKSNDPSLLLMMPCVGFLLGVRQLLIKTGKHVTTIRLIYFFFIWRVVCMLVGDVRNKTRRSSVQLTKWQESIQQYLTEMEKFCDHLMQWQLDYTFIFWLFFSHIAFVCVLNWWFCTTKKNL